MARKINLESALKAESVEKEIAERYSFSGIPSVQQIMGPTADDYRAEGFRDAVDWIKSLIEK